MAEVDAATALVLTVKVALVLPAGTVTLDGTLAAPLLLESITCAPPAGAAPLNVTVPVEVATPETVAGFRVTLNGARGLMASTAGCVEPL